MCWDETWYIPHVDSTSLRKLPFVLQQHALMPAQATEFVNLRRALLQMLVSPTPATTCISTATLMTRQRTTVANATLAIAVQTVL